VTDNSERLQQLKQGHLSRRSFEVLSSVESMFKAVQPPRPMDVSQADVSRAEGFRSAPDSRTAQRITEVR
jgi:hypothetical protein